MRLAITISILLLAFISAIAQDVYVSPGYYPTQIEVLPEWNYNTPLYQSKPEGRGTWWQRNRKSLAITGIQVVSIVMDATGDAVYDMGKESHNDSQMAWGHTLQAVAIGGMGTTLVMLSWDGGVWDGVRFGVGYVAMRYALFDMSYNLARGIDPLYADGWKAKMPPHGRAFTQTIMLGVSISINIIEF